MNKKLKNHIVSCLTIPIGIAAILVPYSLLVGWNLVTLFLFWFLITPILSVYIPTLISKNKNHFSESISGLLLFYSFMVFMIYKHYQSDFFYVMMVSCVINVILIIMISAIRNKSYLKGNVTPDIYN